MFSDKGIKAWLCLPSLAMLAASLTAFGFIEILSVFT